MQSATVGFQSLIAQKLPTSAHTSLGSPGASRFFLTVIALADPFPSGSASAVISAIFIDSRRRRDPCSSAMMDSLLEIGIVTTRAVWETPKDRNPAVRGGRVFASSRALMLAVRDTLSPNRQRAKDYVVDRRV